MLGKGIRHKVVVVVTMGLDCAVTTDELITCLTVDLDGLCRVFGTHGNRLSWCDHFQGSLLKIVEAADFVPL